MSESCAIELAGERLELLPERAIFWPAQRALVCSDLHLGKDRFFRSRFQYVPQDSTRDDLERLRKVIALTGARRVFVVGDLIHNAAVLDEAFIAEFTESWRALGVETTLVAGNHDRKVAPFCERAGMMLVADTVEVGPLRLAHRVELDRGATATPSLSGHWHPVAALRGFADAVRVPCFARVGEAVVLPAFGSFTGGMEFVPDRRTRLYAVGGSRVIGL